MRLLLVAIVGEAGMDEARFVCQCYLDSRNVEGNKANQRGYITYFLNFFVCLDVFTYRYIPVNTARSIYVKGEKISTYSTRAILI